MKVDLSITALLLFSEHRHVLSSQIVVVIIITCCAVAQRRVLRTAWVPYGNMETLTPHSSETSEFITMKLCTFDYVGETNTFAKFGWNPPARDRSTHT